MPNTHTNICQKKKERAERGTNIGCGLKECRPRPFLLISHNYIIIQPQGGRGRPKQVTESVSKQPEINTEPKPISSQMAWSISLFKWRCSLILFVVNTQNSSLLLYLVKTKVMWTDNWKWKCNSEIKDVVYVNKHSDCFLTTNLNGNVPQEGAKFWYMFKYHD